MLQRFIILLAVVLHSAASAAPRRLTRIDEVLRLEVAEVERHIPVEIRAVVTYFRRAETPDLIVQDPTGALFVDEVGKLPALELEPGVEVVLRGVTHREGFSPAIRADSIEIIGRKPLPEPVSASAEELDNGLLVAQYVRISGVVRTQITDDTLVPPRLILGIGMGGRTFDAWVLNYPKAMQVNSLVGAAVTVRGVCVAWQNRRQQLSRLRLLVNNLDDVRIDHAPLQDPFALELVAAENLLRYRPQGLAFGRVRVRGIVTWWRPRDSLVIQDARVGIHVSADATDGVRLGDEIEAVGFPALDGYTAGLQDAIVRVVRHANLPEPENYSARKLTSDTFEVDPDRRLIRVRGTFRALQFEGGVSGGVKLLLDDEGVSFAALLEPHIDRAWAERLEPGSILEITGVCEIRPTPRTQRIGGGPDGFGLLLRDPKDVRTISGGPWLNRHRLLIMLFIGGVVLAAAGLWGVYQRHRVLRRTRQLARQIRLRHDSEVEFDAVLCERTRVSEELHDTLAQGLTGIALQLQAATLAARAHENSPKGDAGQSQDYLARAGQLLARTREELHDTIWNLRHEHGESYNLVSELREAAEGFLTRSGPKIDVTVAGTPETLSVLLNHELLRMGQEALTNASRHARASKIAVSVSYRASVVHLCIDDDGIGFDPSRRLKNDNAHFGLTGMRERARRLGANLKIESTPGKGTRIDIEAPF